MKGKKHTDSSRKKIGLSNKGRLSKEKNPHWKGGNYLTHFGYRRVWVGDIAGAYKGYMLEHRLVMQEFLGRPLQSHEVVHHINDDKTDNRIENLMIVSRSAHMKIHYPPNSKFGINKAKNK